MRNQEVPQVGHIDQALIDLDQVGSGKSRIWNSGLAIVACEVALGESGPVDGAEQAVGVYGHSTTAHKARQQAHRAIKTVYGGRTVPAGRTHAFSLTRKGAV
jgi:hypothetical protein